jgi:hypothetical protein
MILRARVKAFEDMPVGVPCCERMRQALAAFGQRIISVTPAKLKSTRCQFCGAKFRGMRVQGIRGWRIDPRAWDIAEAPEVTTPILVDSGRRVG